MIFTLIYFFFIVWITIVLSKSIKIVREDQRVVIFRLGKYFGVGGPGIVFILPFVDKIQKVDLNESLPGWQTLPKELLEERLKSLVIYKSNSF
ncbi:MAG: SPFH domain-containing protein [Bacteroidota bacterium]